ncbi:MAG: histidine phosphatase family protein [Cyanobacteria bacterium J083]|nr:MAG: histidine phosphatase family protein [Cyanobacteria bacterium J083]
MTQTVWLARHGNRLDFVQPEWFNRAKLRYDPPLSDDGLIQAQKLAERLKTEQISQIFCSPFLRAIQTANEVAKILKLELQLEAGLGEWHNPEWMSYSPKLHPPEFLAKQYPRINWDYKSLVIPHYPETESMVNQRTAKTARLLVKKYYPKNILLVGHSASVIGATKGLVGKEVEIKASLCCLVKLRLHYSLSKPSNQWIVELNGDTSHLTNP